MQLMNRILNEASLRELDPSPGERVVEFGAGLGEFARMVARRTNVAVVSLERSVEQIRQGRALAAAENETHLIEYREGDVYAPPLETSELASFDAAHARFLLEHLENPLLAVQQMLAAVRIGGRIVLEDDDHDLMRLWPEPPGFESLWRAYVRSYERIGNDPLIGRRLVELLVRAGATPVRNTQIFFGSCAGSASFDALVHNLIGILEGALDTVVHFELIDAGYARESIDALREWSTRSDAAFWYTMSWAEARRLT